ncbi:chemotaxis protein CheA [Haliovirga abyssi]|uniref:Chemotaxis protein CheA n=1 Tax=Haliovirga abyssi TaxID=2996794 RepID=A0AAU9D980_9FUSO|nr:chemotaxis protein CheA [Haliovirga abyssi]BDU50151.1 chemotaxis protein CheA [Haliovirga abyssi]
MDENFDMSQFRGDFIEEANEIIEKLDKELLELEKAPKDYELINSIFRSIHTLKGSSAFLNFTVMGELAHKMESLLDKLRNKEMFVDEKIINILLEGIDKIKLMINDIMNNGNGEQNIDEVLKKIIELTEKKVVKENSKEENIERSIDTKIDKILENYNQENIEEIKIKNSQKITSIEKEKNIGEEKKKIESHLIRVDTRKIDDIMNLVGELVTGRNRLLQIGSKFKSEELNENSNFISRLTTELQGSVMKMRMIPLEKVFNKFPRVVRDLSNKLNKKVEFEVSGQDTELDRVVSEEIYEPLVHMIRNALDHGIETPEERMANGKVATGLISINAKQEDNFVFIDIKDDGKGINSDIIRKKALEKGILTQKKIDNMGKYDIINLIFHPGFSTAEEITDISGRGVGMDVVKTSIGKLGGIVDVITEEGKGTTFRVRLPLTLAIMPVLIIGISDKKYAIPLNNVIETRRINKNEIQTISGEQLIFLREKTLNIVYLSSVFNIEEFEREEEKINLVIIGFGEKRVGLVIDEMLGKQEIVIKPLGKYLNNVSGISGTAILGDGNIIMILDSSLIVNKGKSNVKMKKIKYKNIKNNGKD